MSRNLIISEIDLGGITRNYEGEAATLEVNNNPKYVVIFDRLPTYDGEFGFDWMRENYLNGTCVKGIDQLKQIYTPLEMNVKDANKNPFGTYYVPWLSMFPKHKDVIGKEVELIVRVPLEFVSEDVDFEEEFTFEPENGNIRVVPAKLTLSSAINYQIITIYCDAPIGSDTVINVKSSEGLLVGKLNVAKNADYKNYEINIPIVYAYVNDMGDAYNEIFIENEINEKLRGLEVLEKYLNTQSLNQALIQVKFQYKNGEPYKWPFSKQSLISANKGRNTQTGKEDVDYTEFKEMILDLNKMTFDCGKLMGYFHHQFKKVYSDLINKKNIILYLTSLSSAGGAAYVVPLDNKHCIIFRSNLDHLPSFAHEISHTLGLMHSFVDQEFEDQKNFIDQLVAEKIAAEKYLSQNKDCDQSHPYIVHMKNRLKSQKKKIENYQVVFNRDTIKFEFKKTDNLMDYNFSEMRCLNKPQWDIMQGEAQKYYH